MISLYTTSTCPYCKQEGAFLQTNGVEFEKIVLDQQPEKMEEYRQYARSFSGVPLAIVPGENDTVTIIRGFNEQELVEALGLKPTQSDKDQQTSKDKDSAKDSVKDEKLNKDGIQTDSGIPVSKDQEQTATTYQENQTLLQEQQPKDTGVGMNQQQDGVGKVTLQAGA